MLFSAILVAVCISNIIAAPTTPMDLPNPVSVATAKKYLSDLIVAEDVNNPPYSRSQFRHWITISGKCDTRETVLMRDGTDVVTDANCAAVSGEWVSPYDDLDFTVARNLDIDHIVPLKEAWVSGARDWTAIQRQEFANDLVRPQLVAVSAGSNRSKGDKDPAEWVPPLESYRCTYIRAWIQIKHYYTLTIDDKEKEALTNYIDQC